MPHKLPIVSILDVCFFLKRFSGAPTGLPVGWMDSDEFFTKEMADFWQQVVAQRTQELYEVLPRSFHGWRGKVDLRMDGWVGGVRCVVLDIERLFVVLDVYLSGGNKYVYIYIHIFLK